MARIELTQLYGGISGWPGNLFNRVADSQVLDRGAAQFTYRLGESTGFEDYQLRVTGSRFRYDDGEAISGRISRIVVQNDKGQPLLTFSDFGTRGAPGSFADFWLNLFGSVSDGAGPGPNAKTVWSMLMSGNDTIIGSDGADRRALVGVDAGNDRYLMGAGDDEVAGGIGNDTYDGGAGRDLIGFRETHFSEGDGMIRGVHANIDKGFIKDPWGGRDKIAGFEDLGGSRLADRLFGDDAAAGNAFSGYRGNDTIDGGADSYDAANQRLGDVNDWLRYHDDFWLGGRRGIVADLEVTVEDGSIRGQVRDPYGQIDRVIDIEHISGTRFNDRFSGSGADNRFIGGEGKDWYDGGTGTDVIDFTRQFTAAKMGGIRVDLGRDGGQIKNDGFGNIEDAWGVDGIIGTYLGDEILGGQYGERFEGGNGSDTLAGGGGADTFIWNNETEIGEGDVIRDFQTGEDVLSFQVSRFTGMSHSLRLITDWNMTTGEGTFIFDRGTGTLYWDIDGKGDADARIVAEFQGSAVLNAGDFQLV